jgi:hypothetical protein
MHYRPSGPINVVQTQLGSFNESGQVNPTGTPFANSVSNASILVFQNLMSAIGSLDRVSRAVTPSPVDPAVYTAFSRT